MNKELTQKIYGEDAIAIPVTDETIFSTIKEQKENGFSCTNQVNTKDGRYIIVFPTDKMVSQNEEDTE